MSTTTRSAAHPEAGVERAAGTGLPGFVYILMALSGPWALLPYLGRFPSRVFRVLIILASVASLPAVALLPFNWLFLLENRLQEKRNLFWKRIWPG